MPPKSDDFKQKATAAATATPATALPAAASADTASADVNNVTTVKQRVTVLKRLVTRYANLGRAIPPPPNVNIIYNQLKAAYSSLQSKQHELLNLLVEEEESDDVLDQAIESQQVYNDDIEAVVITLQSLLRTKTSQGSDSATGTNSFTNDTEQSSRRKYLPFKLPEIVVPVFVDNTKDYGAFFHFKNSFLNAVSAYPDLSSAHKLTYLKTLLKGRSLSLIVNQQEFDSAWQLLETEFLDSELIINHNFEYLVNAPNVTQVEQIQYLFTEVRFKLLELSKFKLTFTDRDSAANKLLGFIVRSKLPSFFVQELIRRTGSNYPQLDEMLKHVNDVIKLFSTKRLPVSSGGDDQLSSTGTKPKIINKQEVSNIKNTSQSVQKQSDHKIFDTSQSQAVLSCRFCSKNHRSIYCENFPDHKARIDRAVLLRLCTRCLSSKHNEGSCPGKTGKLPFICKLCNSSVHVPPMCPDFVPKNKSK